MALRGGTCCALDRLRKSPAPSHRTAALPCDQRHPNRGLGARLGNLHRTLCKVPLAGSSRQIFNGGMDAHRFRDGQTGTPLRRTGTAAKAVPLGGARGDAGRKNGPLILYKSIPLRIMQHSLWNVLADPSASIQPPIPAHPGRVPANPPGPTHPERMSRSASGPNATWDARWLRSFFLPGGTYPPRARD